MRVILGRTLPGTLPTSHGPNDPTVSRQLGQLFLRGGYEIGEHNHVGGLEDLVDGVVLGREDAAILEALDEGVDMVELFGLGAGEVEDHHRLVVVGMGDVGHLSVGEYNSVMLGDKVSSQEGLPNPSNGVMVPVELARVGLGIDKVNDSLLPGRRLKIGVSNLKGAEACSTVANVIEVPKVGHTPSYCLTILLTLTKLIKRHGLACLNCGVEVGAAAGAGHAGAELGVVAFLGAIVVVLDIGATGLFDVNGLAKVLLHLREPNLLAILDEALVMLAAGVGAGLVADDQVGHGLIIIIGARVGLLLGVDGHAIVLAWGLLRGHGWWSENFGVGDFIEKILVGFVHGALGTHDVANDVAFLFFLFFPQKKFWRHKKFSFFDG